MARSVLKVNRKLAIDGGTPVRSTLLPYGKQSISQEDIQAVTKVLESAWLTTGPAVAHFERSLEKKTGAKHVATVSNGTAALHAALYAVGIGPGDEVLVPTMTFAASANAVRYLGAVPKLTDVDPTTLLITAEEISKNISSRTKAVICVDYAGQPCDYDPIITLAKKHNLKVIVDACHSLGGSYKGRRVGTIGDLSTFSFHPVKHITTGEGGAVSTDHPNLNKKILTFRNHGISTDHRQREEAGTFFYSVDEPGYNYRLSDIQCALGDSQLKHLDEWIKKRQSIAFRYDKEFSSRPWFSPLRTSQAVSHAYHLYVIQLNLDRLGADRAWVFSALRAEGIGVNVHYIPVHLHPFYRELGYKKGQLPNAEAAYERILTLPLFPTMSESDVSSVIEAVERVLSSVLK